jgi:TIR domain-containing protein
MADKLRVFLCHASENKPIVRELYHDLVAAGYTPWLDTEVLLPGMNWDREIRLGLQASDAVIVCVSSVLVDKEGYIQKELRLAQDFQDHKPPGTIFLIPLRLDDCKTPYALKDIQWGDYTAPNGFENLVKALNIRAEQLGREPGEAKKRRS